MLVAQFTRDNQQKGKTMNTPTNRQECETIFNAHQKLSIVFTKKNGERRTMLCTRNTDLIPASTKPKNPDAPVRPPSETNFPVYDLEKMDWRAFTIANLISVEAV